MDKKKTRYRLPVGIPKKKEKKPIREFSVWDLFKMTYRELLQNVYSG